MLAKKGLSAAPSAVAQYVEDVFSTYLYTGNGSTQTITNGIDLAGEGGLVWIKNRTSVHAHKVYDTVNGAYKNLGTSSSSALSNSTSPYGLTSFNNNGFALNDLTSGGYRVNESDQNYASWTFRKAEKFFDVVTYTGDGTARTISHNLGSTPGCIIVKRTDTTGDWYVYHRSNTAAPETDYLLLNSTAATADLDTVWNDTTPTSTVFSVGTNSGVNANGGTYVAYLFAHDAGGFGDAGTDNVISCGSFSYSPSSTDVNLGYEPQWILLKSSSTTSQWNLYDCMRGMFVTTSLSAGVVLYPNLSNAEVTSEYTVYPTANGFTVSGATGLGTIIYIAIRRGPMKTPEAGTEVFSPLKGASTTPGFITGWPVDTLILGYSPGFSGYPVCGARLTGDQVLTSSSTAAQTTNSYYTWDYSNGSLNLAVGSDYIGWNFRRAPGFFDVVCYTGTGSNTTQTHNLGVVPELIIVKRRDTTGAWDTYSSALSNTEYLVVNTTAAKATGATRWNSTTPTSTVFSLGTSTTTNASGGTYVAYLFASVSGVSKVGSYTGNGSSQTINCGFTAGARFVLIKRTDSTGDWVVFDSARGIVSGNDPYLELNTTDAEVTDKDAVDTDNTGFVVNETTGPNVNTNSATYIYLAIA